MIRPVVADMILKIGSPKLRVRTGDVGGGFGMKIFVHPEYPMIVWASRLLKRTVKWIPDRQEAFQSDVQGRDHVSIAEMALDKDCRFIGSRITTYAALGAYLSHFSAFIPTLAGSQMLVGLYTTPTCYVNVKGVMTNTVPTDAYRGAGRPEAAYLLERFVDHIARETGLSPDEIRARNFIKPNQIPYATALGDTYDSGNFEAVMRKGMEKADWKGFSARRAAALAKGKWRGIGMATYVEKCGGGTAGDRHRQVQRRQHGHDLRRQPDQRPGPGDGDPPDRLGAARHRCRPDPLRAGRFGRRARRHDRRQPHGLGGRHRDHRRGRQDHRQGQACGGERDGGRGGRHRV